MAHFRFDHLKLEVGNAVGKRIRFRLQGFSAFELFLKRLCEFNKIDVIFGAGLRDVGRSGVGFFVSFRNGMNSHS